MANIHGVGEIERRNQDNSNNQQANSGDGMNDFPFFSFGNVNPRTQGFLSTMKGIFCPYFKPISFIFSMCIVDLCVFIITIGYSIYSDGLETTNDIFLAPSFSTLIKFGAKVF